MAQNTVGAVEIPLNVFAGYVSQMDPIALPPGASPWCSDVVFQPGGFANRPCLQRYFATPLGNVTTTYAKSYVTPSKIKWTLALDSAGNFWAQNLTAASMPTVLFTTSPGSYAKSCTANGREYVAISNGQVGTDMPYQLTGLANGTIQIDRLTQDGPGASPNVTSVPLPAVNVAAGSTLTLTITEVDPEDLDPTGSFYATINVYVSSSVSNLTIGQSVTIGAASGTTHGSITPFQGVQGPITAIFLGSPNLLIISTYIPAGTDYWKGTAAMTAQLGALARSSNVVTGKTSTAHQLQPGYRVQITNALALPIGGGVSKIVIDNENQPGVATVTTVNPHELSPGGANGAECNVTINGVKPVTLCAALISIAVNGDIATVVMNVGAPVGLAPGSIVTIAGVPTAVFNGIVQVLNVSTTNYSGDTFTYALITANASDSSTTGTVSINWPIPDTATPSYFRVIAAPTPTTFQVAVDYADGTWTTGAVSFAWNGTFYVQTVPATPADGSGNPLTFTYQQYGPDATASAVSGSIVATPYGQAAPGQHQMQVFFIDRQGGFTTPSPPVTFVANGGQYISVTNIPTGPSNIVARGLAFTGAQGALFFFIPTPPQTNGQLVGTATRINDNTTTSALFDFGDPTLFDAEGISTQGENLANQIVLDGALGFGYYGSRLFTYGQRNVVDTLLNMGFDGGALPNTPTIPSGWSGGGAGTITPIRLGFGWQTSATALTQSMYEDYAGAPISRALDVYTLRAWLSAAGTVTATISSVLTSFTSTVTLTATGAGYLQGNFSLAMPATIPEDLIIGITGSGIVVDEMSLVYSENPILNTMFASYANNPAGMDAVSGVIGPQNDTHQTFDLFILRDNLYMLTQDPQGRLHETSQGITEPADWNVVQIGSSSGTVSAFSCTVSQADDATGTGAPAWASWYSINGYMIFGGDEPSKISQEIQRPQGTTFPGAPPDLTAINPAALLTVWSLNDPENKLVYVGIPSGSATAPNVMYVLTYTGLDSAGSIEGNPPIHKSLSGKLVATDLGRKWAPYQLPMNGGALMYQANGTLAVTLFGGNGLTPNTSTARAFGNLYTLNPNLYTDDDFGQSFPLYTTYAFPDKDTAQQNKLNSMKMIAYGKAFMTGVGYGTISFYYTTLANLWPIQMTGYLLNQNPTFDLPFGGGQATGPRFFVQFTVSPNPAGSTASPATDNAMSVSDLSLWLKNNARMLDRGVWP